MSIIKDIEIIKESMSNLRKTSKDNNNKEFLTESKLECCNFDRLTKKYMKKINSRGKTKNYLPKSVDALLLLDKEGTEEFIFIEFKNLAVEDEIYNVINKAKDSMMIFADISELKIDTIRRKSTFILVYRFEKNIEIEKDDYIKSQEKKEPSKKKIRKKIYKKAGEQIVSFNIKQFLEIYYDNIYTLDENEFSEYIRMYEL